MELLLEQIKELLVLDRSLLGRRLGVRYLQNLARFRVGIKVGLGLIQRRFRADS